MFSNFHINYSYWGSGNKETWHFPHGRPSGAPFDFLSISRFLKELPAPYWNKHITKFHWYTNSTTLHITSFMKIILDLEVVHKYVMMRMFVCTLEDSTKMWFESFSGKEISSFKSLIIKAFHKCWDPCYE